MGQLNAATLNRESGSSGAASRFDGKQAGEIEEDNSAFVTGSGQPERSFCLTWSLRLSGLLLVGGFFYLAFSSSGAARL